MPEEKWCQGLSHDLEVINNEKKPIKSFDFVWRILCLVLFLIDDKHGCQVCYECIGSDIKQLGSDLAVVCDAKQVL